MWDHKCKEATIALDSACFGIWRQSLGRITVILYFNIRWREAILNYSPYLQSHVPSYPISLNQARWDYLSIGLDHFLTVSFLFLKISEWGSMRVWKVPRSRLQWDLMGMGIRSPSSVLSSFGPLLQYCSISATIVFPYGNWCNYNMHYQDSLIRPPKGSVTSITKTLDTGWWIGWDHANIRPGF